MVHEACLVDLEPKDFGPILEKLNDHPLVNGVLTISQEELCELYKEMIKENEIDVRDVGLGVQGKKAPNFATELCEVYYFDRVKQLEDGLDKNKELFKDQLNQLKS